MPKGRRRPIEPDPGIEIPLCRFRAGEQPCPFEQHGIPGPQTGLRIEQAEQKLRPTAPKRRVPCPAGIDRHQLPVVGGRINDMLRHQIAPTVQRPHVPHHAHRQFFAGGGAPQGEAIAKLRAAEPQAKRQHRVFTDGRAAGTQQLDRCRVLRRRIFHRDAQGLLLFVLGKNSFVVLRPAQPQFHRSHLGILTFIRYRSRRPSSAP